MDLSTAIRFKKYDNLAFVGAGGKTTAMFVLARELNRQVFVTTSTHLMQNQIPFADHHYMIKAHEKFNIVKPDFGDKIILFTSNKIEDERISGFELEKLEELANFSKQYKAPLLLEADGSRKLPIKAPGDHEPVLPGWVENVVVTVGLSSLGKKFNGNTVHRPEKFKVLANIEYETIIQKKHIVNLLVNKSGGLKNIPPTAKKIVLLNQADSKFLCEEGKNIGYSILNQYDTVIVTSLLSTINNDIFTSEEYKLEEYTKRIRVYEKTAGIILAAGGASRFGSPKQLLNWRGKTFIRHVTEKAIYSGLDPVVVVTGSETEKIKNILKDLPVVFVENNLWKQGQSTSVIKGIKAINKYVGSAIIFLADQPQIDKKIITKLIDAHTVKLDKIIVPFYKNKRANPVLFDRDMFDKILDIKGDVGGRTLFDKYHITKLIWHDANILLDVDTPEDYQKLLKL